MSGNNYPQSYPVLENMLVNTNKRENARHDRGLQHMALGRYSAAAAVRGDGKGAAK